jgi:hypothetical protein
MAMSTTPARPLPRWLMVAGSLWIAFHLLSVAVMIIAARSGPWPSPFGPSTQEPPPFVWNRNSWGAELNQLTFDYLQPLHLATSYHFSSNRTDLPAVRFEVRLKDADGNVYQTLTFPDKDASFWIRHRESLLAENLGGDEPPPMTSPNTLPAPGEQVERVLIWEEEKGNRVFKLRSRPVSEINQNRAVNGPNGWSRLLARSYVRYVLRHHGAESAELVRHSRDVIPPVVLISPLERWPRDLFTEMVADFTEREP